MHNTELATALTMPGDFLFGEAATLAAPSAARAHAPSLGPLAAFTGTFRGNGFNTIFRPNNAETPTELPISVPVGDNVLELNLTEETLSFSPSLGTVPNRGERQGDITLNGVPYLQVINDITTPGRKVGIHFEPGLWMAVPATTDPALDPTVVRMGSIPHGTTITAQGTSCTVEGRPTIAPIDITPFVIGEPAKKVPFPSQTAADDKTARIPQDLGPFLTAGSITQEMLADPATVLRNRIATQNITSTTVITISTTSASPLFGGGTDNIAFLLGSPAASAPNAQTVRLDAVFWIETVQFSLHVPAFGPGQAALIIPADSADAGEPVPEFLVNPTVALTAPRTLKVTATQIQYAQQVFLNFNGLAWPHASVATLVPAHPIPVPASAWA
jgi:hypothetical protein